MSKIDDLINDWGHMHFVAYLYICIGKSDYSLVDEEISEIIDKLNDFMPSEESKDVYEKAMKVYNLQSDTEIISFIKRHTSRFSHSEEEKKKILQDLEDIMEADGIIKDVEMIMYRFVKKTLS